MEIINLTAKQLRQAADLQERIQALQAQLSQILGGAVPAAIATAARGGLKRKISAAGRAAISAAAKARWAKLRGETPGSAQPAAKSKRQMSPIARARLAALARARWRKAKAAGKTSL